MKDMMHWFFVMLSLICGTLLPSGSDSIISCHDLKQEMQLSISNKDGLYVINVLPKNVCADCKIPNTFNIPFDKLPSKIQKWPKDRNIVVHCAGVNCPLGKYAHQHLLDRGFVNVRLYSGGMRDWRNQKFPTIGRCKAGYLKDKA